MDAAVALRDARVRAGMSQAALAARAGTSQATISAYESGATPPTVATFSRLLASAGARLAVESARSPVTEPSPAALERARRKLAQVIALAEALPVRHSPRLRRPRR